MARVFLISTALIVALAASGCGRQPPPAGPGPAQTYRSVQHRLSLAYPAGWAVESLGSGSVRLVPPSARSWQPAQPADIPKEPRVRIDVGEHIRARLGYAYFPAQVDEATFRSWLEERVQRGEAQDLTEQTIGGEVTFQVTEIRESGCERVAYWRVRSLQALVRLSTGCQSAYLAEFGQIVASLQLTE